MSLESTKEQLIALLDDPDYKVIALAGKWGTGKSHMWNEVKRASSNDAVKGALYVSLFGLSDLNSIKLKVLQSALPNADTNPALMGRLRTGLGGIKKVLSSMHSGFSALEELALLAVPSILKNKLIVLDDVERKHRNLDIDEVLGFIDEFTQQHEARFVLILNSDQLDQRDVWNTLHEKVIDQEIRLSASPEESFRIAAELTPSPHAATIYPAVETCGLTNIRIIRKVIKAVNRILEGHEGLTEAVLSRIVPAVVLLSAIHYKGIEDGPTIQFVLDHGTLNDWSFRTEKEDHETEENKRIATWKALLKQLGIVSCDSFELIVVEFLQSGMFHTSEVSAVVRRYAAEDDVLRARQDCSALFESAFWDHAKDEEQLLAEARRLVDRAHLLDAYWVTSLHATISEISGGREIADAVIERWLQEFRKEGHGSIELDDPFERKLHPKIKAEFDGLNVQLQAQLSAYDACVQISKNSGWGPRQEIALRAASTRDFAQIIRTRPPSELKRLMKGMIDLCINRGAYEKHFGSAMDNFTEACREIVVDNDSPRLTALIKQLFKNANLESKIEDPSKTSEVGRVDAARG